MSGAVSPPETTPLVHSQPKCRLPVIVSMLYPRLLLDVKWVVSLPFLKLCTRRQTWRGEIEENEVKVGNLSRIMGLSVSLCSYHFSEWKGHPPGATPVIALLLWDMMVHGCVCLCVCVCVCVACSCFSSSVRWIMTHGARGNGDNLWPLTSRPVSCLVHRLIASNKQRLYYRSHTFIQACHNKSSRFA